MITPFQDNEIKATLSIGLSTLNEKHRKVEEWINEADDCLYESKRSGRNRTTGESVSI
jgi:diguanylate cyclase